MQIINIGDLVDSNPPSPLDRRNQDFNDLRAESKCDPKKPNLITQIADCGVVRQQIIMIINCEKIFYLKSAKSGEAQGLEILQMEQSLSSF